MTISPDFMLDESRVNSEKHRCLFVLEEARLGGPQIYMLNLLEILKGDVELKLVFPEKYSERMVELCKKKTSLTIH